MSEIAKTILDGFTYDVIKGIVGALIMSATLEALARIFTERLKQWRPKIIFFFGAFILFYTMIMIVGERSQRPYLIGSIQQAVAGGQLGSDRDTITVLALNIVNTGTMQTIVKNWKVHAEVGENKYDASFAQMPPTFTFNGIPQTAPGQPTSLTYSNSDNILEKSLTPVQVGALLPGIIFAVFQNVDQTVFRGAVTYTVTFEDVLSRQYSASIKSTGRADLVGTIPGLHTQMVCPVPRGGLPKLGNDILKDMQ